MFFSMIKKKIKDVSFLLGIVYRRVKFSLTGFKIILIKKML